MTGVIDGILLDTRSDTKTTQPAIDDIDESFFLDDEARSLGP
jgi:hypothetical protein